MHFSDFARAHGVEIGDLRTGDKIFRCGTTNHPRSSNGAYFFDGRRGWIQNWETGEAVAWWNDPTAQPWTEADKREWAMRRRTAEDDTRRNQEQAARRAQGIIDAAIPSPHEYLKAKGFPELKSLTNQDGADLIIPMRDVRNNALLGAQVIRLVDNTWQKKMIPGMRAKGAIFRIGPSRAIETILCEGFATGLSIDAACRMMRLNAAVLVCFSASNMQHIASMTTGRRFVFADNDASLTGEKAAQATGLPWVMPDQVGEDANDLHQRAGIMAVSKLIHHAKHQKRA